MLKPLLRRGAAAAGYEGHYATRVNPNKHRLPLDGQSRHGRPGSAVAALADGGRLGLGFHPRLPIVNRSLHF